MENFIAVVKHENDKVTKYQDFAAKSDADAHVATHGGFVADTPDGQLEYWVVDAGNKTLTHDKSSEDADAVKKNAMNEILRLEGKISLRRIRDAFASDDGKKWLDDQEKLIAVERAKL